MIREPAGIYVEVSIAGDMDEVWEKTQEPGLHGRWDLRFTEIDYLPRSPGEPQKFLYATRIGGGIRIEGAGESTGSRDAAGERTSALKFWSDDSKSLIKTGSGYWKYIPDGKAVRFLTWYDYETRFGAAGRFVDRLFFRPLLGWATAWSFDCLRMWIEDGIPPAISRQRALLHALCRLALAFIWLYQGLVPKLLYRHPDELQMLVDAGVSEVNAPATLSAIGGLELAFAIVLLVFWRSRWPLWITVGAMAAATVAVMMNSPQFLVAAFNPITLNLATAALAGAALLAGSMIPTAAHCLRRPGRMPL